MAEVAGNIAGATSSEPVQAEFVPVDLRGFPAGRPPLVDLYHLVSGRFVLYCEAEVAFSEQTRRKLVDNGVLTLYVRVGENTASASSDLARLLSLPDAQVPPLAKAGILYSSALSAAKSVLADPNQPGHQQVAQHLIGLTVAHLLRSPETFYALLQMMRHDFSVYTHSVNVCSYAVALGIKLGLTTPDLRELGFGSLLHDIGKSRVPLAVLQKAASLTREERALMQWHPIWGVEMLEASLRARPLARMVVLHHHERLDGSGYPCGLTEPAISPLVRVVSVADVYDALTSQRPYRGPMCPFDALALMKETVGHQLDEHCYYSFVELLGGRIDEGKRKKPEPN